jgi:antitoxin VapB
MARSTKDSDTDRLGRETRRRGKAIDRARIGQIVAQLAALPVVDARSADALIGYDERGVPT